MTYVLGKIYIGKKKKSKQGFKCTNEYTIKQQTNKLVKELQVENVCKCLKNMC